MPPRPCRAWRGIVIEPPVSRERGHLLLQFPHPGPDIKAERPRPAPRGHGNVTTPAPIKTHLSLQACLCACLLALLCVSPALAQTRTYRVGASDVLTICVFAGGEEQYRSDLTVSSRGSINAPFIGEIQAAGLSPSEIEQKITEPLARDYFVNPDVNVSVKEFRSLHYYISGAVKKPGLYETRSEFTLMELIARAEGVIPERGNVAYIMREGAAQVAAGKNAEELAASVEPIKVDLKRLLDQGDMTVNLSLRPGDLVYIPMEKSLNVAESKIYVEGEVKKPGLYDFQPGMTAMNACILAGGFDRFAAPNRAKIIRKTDGNTEVIDIDLNDVRDGKESDPALKPGDRIHIPETYL
ncbi:MAG: polysaccharide biosynthesis/export family protein [Deltaproteobacteria bacterium]|nr:polysaccharide biosynthesis/export family protein [Deltaproteobacteria bacterium]